MTESAIYSCMKTKRTTNKELLREWLTQKGMGSRVALAYKTGCSTHLIDKMLRPNYSGAPRPEYRFSISTETGIPESVLFPEIKSEETINA